MKGVSGLEPSAVYVICSVYVLSIIIVYSTAIAILYYLGAMQLIMYDTTTDRTDHEEWIKAAHETVDMLVINT
jgi:hypothetical protein